MIGGKIDCDFVVETFIGDDHNCCRINGVISSRQEVETLILRKGIIIYWNPEEMDYIGGRWVGHNPKDGGIN